MGETALEHAYFGLFAVLMFTGAWLDLTSRRLPNGLALAVLLTGVLAVGSTSGLMALASSAAHAALALVVGMLLFRFRLVGGGDAKFYAATAVWFVLGEALRLLLAISLCGVVLAAGYLLWRQWLRRSNRGTAPPADSGVPYGIAIALGALTLHANF